MKQEPSSSKQPEKGGKDPYPWLWMLPLIAYAGPLLGFVLSRYLNEYYAIAVFFLPVLGGIATLILAIEPTSRYGAAGDNTISRLAVVLALVNLLVYPIILFVAYR